VAFDFLAQRKKQRLLAATAYYNLFSAALMTIPVLVTDLLAWQWQLQGQRLKGILLMHQVAECISSVLIWVVWLTEECSESKEESYRDTVWRLRTPWAGPKG
jgi:hypothetical protein